MRDFIEYYLSLGFALIPCAPRSKRPVVPWRRYEEEPPSREQVYRWFSGGEELNVAVILGRPSGNLIAIDFDDAGLYSEFFDREKVEKATMVVKTGKGYHVYFRTVEPVRTARFGRVEIRGDGGITVLPPSIHPSGKRYELVSIPDDIPVVEDVEESVAKKLAKLGLAAPVEFRGASRSLGKGRKKIPPCYRWLFSARIKEGWRNEALCRVVSILNQLGYGEEEIRRRAWRWNLRSCDPPLDEDEFSRTVRSILKGGYAYWCNANLPICTGDMKARCWLYKRDLKRIDRLLSGAALDVDDWLEYYAV